MNIRKKIFPVKEIIYVSALSSDSLTEIVNTKLSDGFYPSEGVIVLGDRLIKEMVKYN